MDKLSFFLLNITLNSLLAFFTAFLLIELLIFLFRIKQGRSASYLRTIPILKLCLDLFLYDFSRWAYLQELNPLNAEKGSRTLTATIGSFNSNNDFLFPSPLTINFSMSGNQTFTISDIIGHLIPIYFLNFFAILFMIVTAVILLKNLVHFYITNKYFNEIIQSKETHERKIQNVQLNSYINKSPFDIVISTKLHSSLFVTGIFSPKIFISKNLYSNLSQNEFEAALGHEIEHIRYKDSLVRFILVIICSIFWWVPTKWLRNKIEQGQEIGCDLRSKAYGIDPVDLVSAICKVAKQNSKEKPPAFAYQLAKKHKIHKRINALLTIAPKRFKKIRFILTASAVCVAFFGIFLGRFWIF
ncbi:MAG: M56 family metallopeptidase [Parachlamydiaceae bacterium]|nr:M56 family metallopeptidase [Parachlamydiaceae bacterium]